MKKYVKELTKRALRDMKASGHEDVWQMLRQEEFKRLYGDAEHYIIDPEVNLKGKV